MINEYKEKRIRKAVVAKKIYNICLGIFIFAVGLLVLFLKRINNEVLNEYLDFRDPLLQNMFGGLCILYGVFRLYRGIKKEF